MEFIPCTQDPDHPALRALPASPGLLHIEGRSSVFVVLLAHCTSPSCLCRDLQLILEERTEDGDPMPEGLRLSASVDADEGHLRHPERLGAAERIFFEQALGALPPALLPDAADDVLARKRSLLALEAATIPLDEIRGGILQSWFDLSTEGKGIGKPGGDQAAGALERDGHRWLFDALFCPDPKCDCRSVHLWAVRVKPEGSRRAEASFLVTRSLDGGAFEVTNCHDCTPARARAVAQAWWDGLDEPERHFARQYDEVRGVADRCLRQVRSDTRSKPRRKVGRNGPCPCGSGRKYKACCLGKRS